MPPTIPPADTVSRLAGACACVWWQLTSFVRVSGADAVELLDAICTQDIAGIPVGTARHGLFLDGKARIVVPTVIYRQGEASVLLEVDPADEMTLIAHVSKYRLRRAASIEPAQLCSVSIVGDAASAWVAGLDESGSLESGQWYRAPGFSAAAQTWIGDASGAGVIVDIAASDSACGLADPESLDAARIDAGVPSIGDFVHGRMPAEVGAESLAVSFDKGCYLGQEPVARLHWRGRPNRTLRRVELEGDLPDDESVTDDSPGPLPLDAPSDVAAPAATARPKGELTSWACHPDGRVVGLAVLRREIDASAPLQVRGSATIVRPVDAAPAVAAPS